MENSEFSTRLLQKFHLDLEKPVLLGFSGGPDSLCLLHLLKWGGFRVIAAHLDHALRPTSAAEAIQAGETCRSIDVPFITCRIDAAVYARENKVSIEEAAREVRYRFLFDQAELASAQAVVVGHHAGDQVETVLMHLLRGSGLGGLAGMRSRLLPNPWSNTIPLVRPLLQYNREEIENYCQENALISISDESNTNTRYTRNRIRHQLIPQLMSFNPQIQQRLVQTAGVLALEDDYMMGETEQAWQSILQQHGRRVLVLDRQVLTALHPAISRRVIRKGIGVLNKDLRDIDFAVIDRALVFINKPNRSNQVELIAGINLLIDRKNWLVMTSGADPLDELWPQCDPGCNISIPVPGVVELNAYWELRANMVSQFENEEDCADICYLDANVMNPGLAIGTFKAGDRFCPYGMQGKSLKLGDFWTNHGLPMRARQRWPLVRAGEEIVWVAGFRPGHFARVKPETREILRMELLRKSGPEA